jgi:hypothetical protein
MNTTKKPAMRVSMTPPSTLTLWATSWANVESWSPLGVNTLSGLNPIAAPWTPCDAPFGVLGGLVCRENNMPEPAENVHSLKNTMRQICLDRIDWHPPLIRVASSCALLPITFLIDDHSVRADGSTGHPKLACHSGGCDWQALQFDTRGQDLLRTGPGRKFSSRERQPQLRSTWVVDPKQGLPNAQ